MQSNLMQYEDEYGEKNLYYILCRWSSWSSNLWKIMIESILRQTLISDILNYVSNKLDLSHKCNYKLYKERTNN